MQHPIIFSDAYDKTISLEHHLSIVIKSWEVEIKDAQEERLHDTLSLWFIKSQTQFLHLFTKEPKSDNAWTIIFQNFEEIEVNLKAYEKAT